MVNVDDVLSNNWKENYYLPPVIHTFVVVTNSKEWRIEREGTRTSQWREQ